MPRDMFDQINFLPDPVPESDGHYRELELKLQKVTDRHCRKDSIVRKVCLFLLLCNMQEIPILWCNVRSVVVRIWPPSASVELSGG